MRATCSDLSAEALVAAGVFTTKDGALFGQRCEAAGQSGKRPRPGVSPVSWWRFRSGMSAKGTAPDVAGGVRQYRRAGCGQRRRAERGGRGSAPRWRLRSPSGSPSTGTARSWPSGVLPGACWPANRQRCPVTNASQTLAGLTVVVTGSCPATPATAATAAVAARGRQGGRFGLQEHRLRGGG